MDIAEVLEKCFNGINRLYTSDDYFERVIFDFEINYFLTRMNECINADKTLLMYKNSIIMCEICVEINHFNNDIFNILYYRDDLTKEEYKKLNKSIIDKQKTIKKLYNHVLAKKIAPFLCYIDLQLRSYQSKIQEKMVKLKK